LVEDVEDYDCLLNVSIRPFLLIATYVIGIDRRNAREDVLVDKLDRHFSRSICGPGIDHIEESLNLVMREYIICISPIVRWDIVYSTCNLSDDSEIVARSLKGPEEIFVMKSVQYEEERNILCGVSRKTSLLRPRISDVPEFSVAETEITSPVPSTTRAEMRLSDIRP
jgi:hypothetical protein